MRYLGERSDESLVELYNLADAFVLPSSYEGFGLPVLEAMACGTPVVVSERSSLPEVGGEAARYFDPESVDALEGVLYTVLSDNDLRKKMSIQGTIQAQKFSWQKAAAETLAVYHRVLG
jgi:glycosyltransferase involved in cell wall biosynthesis